MIHDTRCVVLFVFSLLPSSFDGRLGHLYLLFSLLLTSRLMTYSCGIRNGRQDWNLFSLYTDFVCFYHCLVLFCFVSLALVMD